MNLHQPLNLDQASPLILNRRDLLKLVGGGLVFGIFVPEVSGALAKLPSAYLRIEEDGTVTLLSLFHLCVR
jgi:hypothetical protein